MSIVKIVKEGSSYLSFDNVEELSFNSPDELNEQTFIDSKGIILDTADINSARVIIKRIRTFDGNNTYLKPVFLMSPQPLKDNHLGSLADGTVDPERLSGIHSEVRRIQEKISKLEPAKADNFDFNVLLKILRYLFTREKELEPVLDEHSWLGYSYPFVSVNFNHNDEHKVFEILEIAESERLIEGRFVDKVNLCDKCYSSFLNFREVCPKCGSADLKVEDLIHHFVCAYVGPESDFRTDGDDEMTCPKCRRTVRHIGVDYDKPGVIYICNKSHDKFQDPKVKAFCFRCQNDALVESLLEKNIKTYRLTSKGEHAAVYGITIAMKDIIKIPGLVDFTVLKKFVQYEVERFKRIERNGCVAYLQFHNFNDLYILGGAKEKIFPEIVELIKNSVRPSDVISYLNEATLFFFLTDTSLENASVPIDRLKNNLVKLVHDNFSSLEAKISTEVLPIHKSFQLDDIVKKISSP